MEASLIRAWTAAAHARIPSRGSSIRDESPRREIAAVKKAVRGLIGSGNDALHHVVDKTDELATRAEKALAPAKTKVKAVARAAKPAGKKPARRKTRPSHAST